MPKVFDAWVSATNDAGGINGHPVKVIYRDDQGDPAKSQQAAKELVEKEKVVAILFTSNSPGAATYLNTTDVPIIGYDNTGGAFEPGHFFQIGAGLAVQQTGSLEMATAAGKQSYGFMYCSEAPACAEVDKYKTELSGPIGLDYHSWAIGMSAPDYTSQCLAAKDAGVDILEVGAFSSVIQKIFETCGSQQFDPTGIGGFYAASNATIASPTFEGFKIWSPYASFQDPSVPGAKAYSDAMTKYESSTFKDPEFSGIYTQAWAAGEMFLVAADAADLGPDSSRADLADGLYTVKDETLDGLIPPTSYTKDGDATQLCYFDLTIQDNKLGGSTEPDCVEPDLVALVS